jgi:hypothetical protein
MANEKPPITDVGDELADWLAREVAGLILRVNYYTGRKPSSLPSAQAQAQGTGYPSVEVPVAPPVPQELTSVPYQLAPGYGRIDDVVSAPVVRRPEVAARVSQFPLRVFSKKEKVETLANASILGQPFEVPSDGLVSISGALDVSSSPSVIQYTLDGGQTWIALNSGQPVQPGSGFSFSPNVAALDQFDLSTSTNATLSRVLVDFEEALPFVPAQGFAGAVPVATPGVPPAPTLFVPVSSFPVLVGKVTSGQNASAGQLLIGPYTVPAPGTIAVFGFIASGQATFAVSIESVQGVAQYGTLNGGAALVPGAWTAATIQVDKSDVFNLTVTAACTVGSVRVTFTPST